MRKSMNFTGENISKYLQKILYITMIVFPFSVALYLATKLFLKIPNINKTSNAEELMAMLNNQAIGVLTVVLGVGLVFWFLKSKLADKTLVAKNNNKIAAGLFVFGTIIRMSIFFPLKNILAPYSDGEHSWLIAQGDNTYLKTKIHQNGWNNFTGFEKFLVQTFDPEFSTLVFINFLLDALMIILIYFIAVKVFKSPKVAFLASLFYAVTPDIVFRPAYMSSEVFSQACTTLATLLVLRLFEEDTIDKKNLRSKLIIIMGIGITTGIGHTFKSSAVIFVIALIIVQILRLLCQKGKKNVIYAALMIILIAIPAFGINKIALKGTSKILGAEANDYNTMHFLYVGLALDGEGQRSIGKKARYYENMILDGVPVETAKDLAITYLKQEWKNNPDQIIPLLQHKTSWAWQDGMSNYILLSGIANWNNSASPLQSLFLWVLADFGCSFSQVFYIATLISTIIGLVVISKKHINNSGALFVCLNIFGFALMLLLIESGARYKANIWQFVCIIAGFGAYKLVEMIKFTNKNPENVKNLKDAQ